MSRRHCVCVVVLIASGIPLAAQEPAEQARDLQSKFKAEREAAGRQGFAPELFERADKMAARGDAALAGGQTREAASAFRDARWLLPIQPAELPANVSRVFSYPRLRHGADVTGLAYSPDGQRLVTCSKDGSVRIWDLANGREIRAYRGHGDAVRAVAWAPNGKFVASAAGNDIHIWNPDDGKFIRRLTGHTKLVQCLAIRPDSKAIASGGDDDTLRVWDADSDKLLIDLGKQQGPIMGVAYNSSGKMLASVNGNGRLHIHIPDATETSKRSPVDQVAHTSGAYQVAFSPEDKFVATCGDRSAKLFGLGDKMGLRLNEFTGHNGLVTALAVSKDGKWLATGTAGAGDYMVRVFEVASTDKLVRTFQGHQSQITGLAFSPDGETLASASMDQNVRLWSMRPVDSHKSFEGHTNFVWSAVMRLDGKQIASGGADRTVRLWDTSTGKQQHELKGHQLPVTTVVYSPNGQIVVSCGGDKLLKAWDANTGQPLRDFTGHEAAVMAAAYSSDGSRIISGAADRLVKLWDAAAGKELATMKGHRSAVSAVAMRYDGKTAASGGADGIVYFWDLEKKEPIAHFTAHSGGVAALAYTPDGQRLATCGSDKRVRVWSIPAAGTPDMMFEFTGHIAPVSSVAVSPDGRWLASGGGDNLVKVWSLQTRTEVRTLRGHSDWVSSVAFSTDNKQIISASVDRSVKLWDVQSQEIAVSMGHTRGLRVIAVSSDGKRFATGGDDHVIKVWDSASGAEKLTLAGHAEEVQAIAFAPDARRLISSALDRTLRIWDLDTGREIKRLEMLPRVPALQFLPGGKKFVAWYLSSSDENTVSTLQTFDMDGNILKSHADPKRNVTCLSFSPDGEVAASGDSGGTVRRFMVENGERIRGDMPASAKSLMDLALTPDKKTLITGDEDGVVKIWDLTKNPIESLEAITAHKNGLIGIIVSPDGKRLATTSRDGQVRLWTWDEKEPKQLRDWNLKVPVRGLAFLTGGKQILAANADASVFVLELP